MGTGPRDGTCSGSSERREAGADQPRPASADQVAVALAAAAAIGPFFAVAADPTGEGWTRLTGPLAPFVDDVAARLGTSERRVAASILFQGLAARLVSPVLAGLEQGIVLDLDGALVRQVPGEGIQVGCRAPHGWTSTSAQVVASVLVEGQLRPLVARLADEGPVAEGLLWGNAASALTGALTVMRGGAVAPGVVRRLLESAPLAGTLDERGRRRSCCLFYRAVADAYCGDCALTARPG